MLFVAAAIAVFAVGAFHLISAGRLNRDRARENSDRTQLLAQKSRIEALRHRIDEARRQGSRSIEVGKSPKSSSGQGPAGPGRSDTGNRARLAKIAGSREWRSMTVQAYVDSRQLAFAGVLRKLGLNADQLQKFNEIEASYEQGLLDLANSADTTDPAPSGVTRRQLAAAEQAQLRELFGSGYGQWEEAVQTQGARQIVSQMLQLNLQNESASLSGALSDQLTQLLAANGPGGQNSNPAAYDWEAILKRAQTVLSPDQMDALSTCMIYYQAQAQMAAMARIGR